ncbi:MAG: alpha/beta fold hydrolase [Actinophytocola sp.]|uniref:alpha/beta fold hydrolase n=1 Tax=Actinophytocola sp. TaxID=1872138 RepID=UPI003D6C39AB
MRSPLQLRPVVADDGRRLWANTIGAGEPLVVCHGGPGMWDMFGDAAAMLADRLKVIRWDQRGCGRSERRGPYSMARAAADLDAVRAHFGLDRFALLGHSWGAQLALRYTLDNPDRVAKLVYVAGTGLGFDWHEEYERNLAARLGPNLARLDELRDRERSVEQDRDLAILRWSADFADPATAVAHAERMATPWLEVNYECNAVINAEDRRTWREAELVEACRELSVPTLIIDGERDPRPRRAVDSLADALPSMTRVTLPEVGHVPWLEAPEEFRKALVAFVCKP